MAIKITEQKQLDFDSDLGETAVWVDITEGSGYFTGKGGDCIHFDSIEEFGEYLTLMKKVMVTWKGVI